MPAASAAWNDAAALSGVDRAYAAAPRTATDDS